MLAVRFESERGPVTEVVPAGPTAAPEPDPSYSGCPSRIEQGWPSWTGLAGSDAIYAVKGGVPWRMPVE